MQIDTTSNHNEDEKLDEYDSLIQRKTPVKKAPHADNLQEALDLSGGFGRFQILLSAIAIISDLRTACVYFALPLLELEPSFEC